jgi:hypothetical protein
VLETIPSESITNGIRTFFKSSEKSNNRLILKNYLLKTTITKLGSTLMPDKIKPVKSKLKAIKDTKPPTDAKTIWSLVGLCNFFQHNLLSALLKPCGLLFT